MSSPVIPAATSQTAASAGFDAPRRRVIRIAAIGLAAPLAIASRPAAVARALRGMLTNPLPWAIALGTLSSATGLLLPKPLMSAVEMLAAAASPVALFALGCMLARSQMAQPAPRAARGLLGIVACKLVLHPLVVLAAGRLAIAVGVPLDPFSAVVLVLVAALPSASNVPMLAERFGADAGRIARVVFFSTVGAFVTFTAVVAWVDAAGIAAPLAPGAR